MGVVEPEGDEAMLPRRVEDVRRKAMAKGSVGEDMELADEVLPKRRWVEG